VTEQRKSGAGPSPGAGPGDFQEIFNEDHLEFEELLLDLHKKVDAIFTQIRFLAQQVADSRADLIESREMIENLQGKTDRLHTIVSEWQRERADELSGK
jgi:uncharacterized coiled-coil DUF342 family protein